MIFKFVTMTISLRVPCHGMPAAGANMPAAGPGIIYRRMLSSWPVNAAVRQIIDATAQPGRSQRWQAVTKETAAPQHCSIRRMKNSTARWMTSSRMCSLLP